MLDDPRLPARFWDKIEESGDGCWLWTATKTAGYGYFWWQRSMVRVHRLTYETLVGPIPEGREIDHLCRVRECCNPEHVEAVAHRTNVLRGETIAAANAAKTHCPKLHPLSGDNLIVNGSARRCRTCRRATVLAAMHRLNARRRLADAARS